MLQFVVALVVYLGSMVSCFSHEVPKNVDWFGDSVSSSAIYTACGNIHLLVKDYELAFQDFNKAKACMEQLGEDSPMEQLLLHFGQTVVYDNLHLRDECEKSLSALILTIAKIDEMEDDDDEDYEEEDDEEDEEIFRSIIDMVRSIALQAPSDDVREILVSLVDSLNEKFEIEP